jgi:hypothetical protein
MIFIVCGILLVALSILFFKVGKERTVTTIPEDLEKIRRLNAIWEERERMRRERMTDILKKYGIINETITPWQLPNSWRVEIDRETFISLLWQLKPNEMVFCSFYHTLGDTHDVGFALEPDYHAYVTTSLYGWQEDELTYTIDTTKSNDPQSQWTGPRVHRKQIDWEKSLRPPTT